MLEKLWQGVKAMLMGTTTLEPTEEVDMSTLSILERCALVYEQLDTKPFLSYRQTDGNGKVVSVVHENIEVCLEDLSHYIQRLETSKFVPQSRDFERIVKPFNRFFITKEGCYLESIGITINDLRTVVLDLCSAVNKTKESDYYSYNLRMLNALLFTLYDLGYRLTDIANEIKQRS